MAEIYNPSISTVRWEAEVRNNHLEVLREEAKIRKTLPQQNER